MLENKKCFLSECQKLLLSNYEDENYFDKVQENHRNIRKLINNPSVEVAVEFVNKNKPISNDDFKPIIQILKEAIPHLEDDLYNYYGRSLNDLKMPLLRSYDTNHKFIKSSKFISGEIDYKINKESKAKVDKCLAQLGRLWQLNSTKSGNITTELSTKAIDFLKLGMFGPDNASCFRPTGSSNFTRPVVGKISDSYVIKFYENKKIIARAIGALTNKNVMNFFNFYIDKGASEGNLLESLKTLYATVFNVPEDSIQEYKNKIDMLSPVYLNSYETTSLTTRRTLNLQII